MTGSLYLATLSGLGPLSENLREFYWISLRVLKDISSILTRNCLASRAYLILLLTVSDIIASIVWILNNLSKWMQFKV